MNSPLSSEYYGSILDQCPSAPKTEITRPFVRMRKPSPVAENQSTAGLERYFAFDLISRVHPETLESHGRKSWIKRFTAWYISSNSGLFTPPEKRNFSYECFKSSVRQRNPLKSPKIRLESVSNPKTTSLSKEKTFER